MSNRRTFFYYVIPSVLSFALSGIYAIVDGFFVGNSIGDAGLSAINIAYPITAVLVATGTVLQVFGTGMVPFMRNYGGAMWAMIAMICGFATNVTLDYILVWVLNRGMTGAALATVIGQGVTMAAALVYCAAKRKLFLKMTSGDMGVRALQIIKIGLAPFGLTLAPEISLVIINRFSASYGGQQAIATYACISYVICIIYLLLQGVGDGSGGHCAVCFYKDAERA